jgi:hypothetical protein
MRHMISVTVGIWDLNGWSFLCLEWWRLELCSSVLRPWYFVGIALADETTPRTVIAYPGD